MAPPRLIAAASLTAVAVAVAIYRRFRAQQATVRLHAFKLGSQAAQDEAARLVGEGQYLDVLRSDKEDGSLLLVERSMWLLNMPRIDMGAAVQLPVEEFTETGLGFMGRNGQLSRGGWCLLVKLTFGSGIDADVFQALFCEYARWIQEHEPATLAWEVMRSKRSLHHFLFFGRYEDKELAYATVHRGSSRFAAFRQKLGGMNPVVDGHSYVPQRKKKLLLLTKADARGDRAETAARQIFARSQYDVEVLRIENGKPKPKDHDFRCDWLISYVCPWVLPASVLRQAQRNVNFHPGPPEYPGTGCYNFALYDGAAEYGVTAHRMETTVDSGGIYAVKRFPVLACDSADTLQDRADGVMFELYRQTLTQLATGRGDLPFVHPPEHWHPTKKATTSKDLDRLRVIPLDASVDEVRRRVRAMAHRCYPTGGACVELHGRRFFIPFDDVMRDLQGS